MAKPWQRRYSETPVEEFQRAFSTSNAEDNLQVRQGRGNASCTSGILLSGDLGLSFQPFVKWAPQLSCQSRRSVQHRGRSTWPGFPPSTIASCPMIVVVWGRRVRGQKQRGSDSCSIPRGGPCGMLKFRHLWCGDKCDLVLSNLISAKLVSFTPLQHFSRWANTGYQKRNISATWILRHIHCRRCALTTAAWKWPPTQGKCWAVHPRDLQV